MQLWLLLITLCAQIIDGVASADPVFQCILICSVGLRNIRHVNVFARVPYDGVGFAKVSATIEGEEA